MEKVMQKKVKQFFNSLVGLDISEALKKLGYWWQLENCNLNGWTGEGIYSVCRAAGGWLELKTKENIVVREHHNYIAELYQQDDLL